MLSISEAPLKFVNQLKKPSVTVKVNVACSSQNDCMKFACQKEKKLLLVLVLPKRERFKCISSA